MAENTETTTTKKCGHSHLASGLGTLIVRVMMAIIFIYYGGQHLFGLFGGHGIHSFSNMLASDHFPVLPAIVWAYISGITEFFGGILIILGLFSRIVSIFLILDLTGIIWASHAGGFGSYDFQLALMAIAASILIAGPGKLSVDASMCRGCCGKEHKK